MAGVYYETPVQSCGPVPNGASLIFAIPFPTRTRLVKLNCVQDGLTAAVAFQVDLFNHVVPNSPSANNQDFLWLISDTNGIQSDAAGMLVHKFPDYDVFFLNKDAETFVQAQGQNTPSRVDIVSHRRIYLRITNLGANPATFNVILGSESALEF